MKNSFQILVEKDIEPENREKADKFNEKAKDLI